MQEVKEKKDSIMVVDNKKEIANISVPNEGTSESKKIGNNKTRDVLIFILILAFIVLFITIISTIFGVINNQNNKIINGVKINGIADSSMEKAEAISKLNEQLNNSQNNYIEVYHGNYKKTILLSDIAGSFDVEEAVDMAFNLGREGDIIQNNYKTIGVMIKKANINAGFRYDTELLEKKIEEISVELPDVATSSTYIRENDKIIIKNSKSGIQIQEEEFKKKIIEVFANGNKVYYLEIPVEKAEKKEIDIEKIHNEIYKKPVNAYYTTNPYKIYKEQEGLDFAITLNEAEAMLSEDKEEYEIPLKITKPSITVSDLDQNAFPNKLASFTTYYGTADVNRNANIALACRSISSAVVMPGETFSYNNLIGECSTRTGYKESTIYLNGELSKGIGGGICQVSTTLYNAVLRANLEIVERRNHSLGVTYVPAGQDAMVSIGSSDFKFKNNREYPVRVTAFVGKGSVTCQIYGLKQQTEYDVKLESRVIERTGTKYKVETYKVLYLNGKEVARTWLSKDTYKVH